MYRKIILIILLLLTADSARADVFISEKDLKPFADKIMELVIKGDILKAFDAMKPYLVIPEAEFKSAAQNSKSQREQFAERIGSPIGYEFIGQKSVGTSLVRLVYIEKTEKQALIWAFYFYKAKAGWVLNSFVWDDQTPALFQIH